MAEISLTDDEFRAIASRLRGLISLPEDSDVPATAKRVLKYLLSLIEKDSPKMPTIWHSILMGNKPDLADYGFDTTLDLAGGMIGGTPDQSEVDLRLSNASVSSEDSTRLLVIDDSADSGESSWDAVDEIDSFVSMAALIKASPNYPTNAKLAYYGVFPDRQYFRVIDYPSGESWDNWIGELDTQEASGITDAVDVLCPSIYQFFRSGANNEVYTRQMIRQARERKPDIPLYPFLWHTFHDSGDFPATQISAISEASTARITIVNSGGKPGENCESGDIWYIGRESDNPPTYPDVGGMTEIRDSISIVSKVDDDEFDMLEINSSGYTSFTSGGGISVMIPLDQLLLQMQICIEEADGFVWWGGFLQDFPTFEAHGYGRAALGFVSNTSYPVLSLNGTEVIAVHACTPRNIRKVTEAIGGDGWCFADTAPSKSVGDSITGQAHGTDFYFYPYVTA